MGQKQMDIKNNQKPQQVNEPQTKTMTKEKIIMDPSISKAISKFFLILTTVCYLGIITLSGYRVYTDLIVGTSTYSIIIRLAQFVVFVFLIFVFYKSVKHGFAPKFAFISAGIFLVVPIVHIVIAIAINKLYLILPVGLVYELITVVILIINNILYYYNNQQLYN